MTRYGIDRRSLSPALFLSTLLLFTILFMVPAFVAIELRAAWAKENLGLLFGAALIPSLLIAFKMAKGHEKELAGQFVTVEDDRIRSTMKISPAARARPQAENDETADAAAKNILDEAAFKDVCGVEIIRRGSRNMIGKAYILLLRTAQGYLQIPLNDDIVRGRKLVPVGAGGNPLARTGKGPYPGYALVSEIYPHLAEAPWKAYEEYRGESRTARTDYDFQGVENPWGGKGKTVHKGGISPQMSKKIILIAVAIGSMIMAGMLGCLHFMRQQSKARHQQLMEEIKKEKMRQQMETDQPAAAPSPPSPPAAPNSTRTNTSTTT